jgi:hypothetical protein
MHDYWTWRTSMAYYRGSTRVGTRRRHEQFFPLRSRAKRATWLRVRTSAPIMMSPLLHHNRVDHLMGLLKGF